MSRLVNCEPHGISYLRLSSCRKSTGITDMCYDLYIYTGTESLNSGPYTCTRDTLLSDLCLQLPDSNSNLIMIFVIVLLALYIHLRKTRGTRSVIIKKEG